MNSLWSVRLTLRTAMGNLRARPASMPRWLVFAALIASAVACSVPDTRALERPATSAVTLLPAWTPTAAIATPSTAAPTVEPTPPAAQSTPGARPAVLPVNACDLLPVERVEAVFEEPVTQTAPAANVCMHVLASGRSVTAAVYRGDAARGVLINPIAQLSAQEGCTLSASFSGELGAPTQQPTSLPPEVEALVVGKSLFELARTLVDLTVAQCDRLLDMVVGIGDLAFFQPLDLGFVETENLAVVTGDAYVIFTLAVPDPDSDLETEALELSQAEEWLKSLALPALATAR